MLLKLINMGKCCSSQKKSEIKAKIPIRDQVSQVNQPVGVDNNQSCKEIPAPHGISSIKEQDLALKSSDTIKQICEKSIEIMLEESFHNQSIVSAKKRTETSKITEHPTEIQNSLSLFHDANTEQMSRERSKSPNLNTYINKAHKNRKPRPDIQLIQNEIERAKESVAKSLALTSKSQIKYSKGYKNKSKAQETNLSLKKVNESN